MQETTGWIDPIIDDGDLVSHDYNRLKLNKNHSCWKINNELLQLSVSESSGKCIPNYTAIGGCDDTLVAMRSSEKLLYDVIECPEYIRDFEIYLMKQWVEIFEQMYSATHEGAEGSTSWFGLWAY